MERLQIARIGATTHDFSLGMVDAVIARRYVTAWSKLKSLLADRGINTEGVNKTESDFERLLEDGQSLSGQLFERSDGEPQLTILQLKEKLSLKTANTILENIGKNRTLVVYSSSITPQAKALLFGTGHVELHEEEQFLRLTRPENVLEVAILGAEDKEQFLGLFGITEEMIPEAKEDEPIAKYYGLLPGDIVKLTEMRDGSRFETFRRIIRT